MTLVLYQFTEMFFSVCFLDLTQRYISHSKLRSDGGERSQNIFFLVV